MLNNNNIQEIWKPIPGFESFYEASTLGNIRAFRTQKVLKTYTINSGYQCLKFTVNSKRTSHLVHRLIALTFLDNPEEKATVNHQDGNKNNNSLTNLEWNTISENLVHAYATELHSKELCKSYIGKKHAKNLLLNIIMLLTIKVEINLVQKVTHNAVNYGFKRFDTEVEAALHVNWIIDTYNLDRPKNIIEMPND